MISQFSSYFAAKVTSASVVRVAVLSVLRLIPMGVFDGATFSNIGRARLNTWSSGSQSG